MIFKSSQEVIALIEQKKRNGIALSQLRKYMENLNNPQLQLSCIHVGGTNGKGSTTSILASVLKEAGYKVGTFTSPYLETHHDRIRINDVFIDEESIVKYANAHYERWVEYDLSMFEIDMVIATLYFVEHNVDYAIFEVGLGGTQDATNIIDPLVSVITNIGKDHMEFLGDSYKEIAQAKAGIIKANKALITSETKKECLEVFEAKCAIENAKMITIKQPTNVVVDTCLHFDYHNFKNIQQPTLASYQAINTALAMETLLYLRSLHVVQFSDEQLRNAIALTKWKGRFEVICEKPMIIIDGAHNEEGIAALAKACEVFSHVKILFTALQDKPYQKMLNQLFKVSNDICVCEFDFYRAQTAKEIAKGFPVRIIEDYREAITTLSQELKTDEVLIICGSLYFISDVRAYLLDK